MKETFETTFGVLGLDNEVILTYCKLYNALKQKGEMLPDADPLIAATAITKKQKLISKDKNLQRLKAFGLELEENIKR